MRKLTILAALLVVGCAGHDQAAMDQAVAMCSTPLAPGEVEDFAEVDYCVRRNYGEIAQARRQIAAESLAKSFQDVNTSAMSTIPKTARCSTYNGITSCTGR